MAYSLSLMTLIFIKLLLGSARMGVATRLIWGLNCSGPAPRRGDRARVGLIRSLDS